MLCRAGTPRAPRRRPPRDRQRRRTAPHPTHSRRPPRYRPDRRSRSPRRRTRPHNVPRAPRATASDGELVGGPHAQGSPSDAVKDLNSS